MVSELDETETNYSSLLTEDEEAQINENIAPSDVELIYRTQDFTVDSLISRLTSGHIIIPSSDYDADDLTTERFQRDYVWKKSQMDRFIESILLGYPLPGIFLVRQSLDKKLLVLDGQQRLRTLQAFYSGNYMRGTKHAAFRLDNVTENLRGLTIETLPADLRRALDDTYMQGTIIEVNNDPHTLSAVYSLFERLNTGGTFLTPHEIRIALFSGKLFRELDSICTDNNWRTLYGNTPTRKRDHELLLRIFAFSMGGEKYAPPLKGFLNRAAENYSDLSTDAGKAAISALKKAINTLASSMGSDGFRRSNTLVNAADAEAVLSTLTRHFIARPDSNISAEVINNWVNLLRQNQTFQTATSVATANLQAATNRRTIADKTFQQTLDTNL